MADPKKPEEKAEAAPAEAPPAPAPQQYTDTGAPVDDRFSHPQEQGVPQHLKNAETEAAAAQQQSTKSKAAKAEEKTKR